MTRRNFLSALVAAMLLPRKPWRVDLWGFRIVGVSNEHVRGYFIAGHEFYWPA